MYVPVGDPYVSPEQPTGAYPIRSAIQYWESVSSSSGSGRQSPPTPEISPKRRRLYSPTAPVEVSELPPVPELPARRPFTPPSVPYIQLRNVRVANPADQLDRAYAEAESEPNIGVGANWSGELHVSSASDGQHRTDQQKEDRYIQELSRKGLDIDLDDELGSGEFGTVYRGRYNEQIVNIGGLSQRYLKGVTPGQGFAVKSVQFYPYSELSFRLAHEVEKCVLKSLRHPNIVSYRLAINLGKHRVLSRKSGQSDDGTEGPTGRDIISYDRMFLIMELSDRGCLHDFWRTKEFQEFAAPLAILLIQQLCSAMAHMQDIGVAHLDIHTGNVLVFSGAVIDKYAAKWSDFGTAVSRDLYRGWGVTIPADHMHAMMRRDTIELASVCKGLIDVCPTHEGVDPGLWQHMIALVGELKQAMQPLGDILKKRSRIQADFGVPSGEPFGDTLDLQTPADPTSFDPTLLDTNTPVIPGAILTPQHVPYGYAPAYTRPASPAPLYSTELSASGIFGPPVDPEYPIESPAQSPTPATPVRRYRSVSLPTVLYTTGSDDPYGTDEPIPGLLTPAGQGLRRWQPVAALTALPPTPDTSPTVGVSSVSASPVADTRRPFTPPSVPYDQLRDVKVTDPLQMLDMAYDEASGYGSDVGASGGNVGNIWSGELHISSDDQGSDDDDDDQDAGPRDAKVDRYVQQLRDYGLDIDMDNELGSGAFGSAYLGQYNEQIANIEGQKYLLGVTPGQGFAAKFVRFSSDTDLDTRLAHEVEKCTLKSLRHQNIVSYRLAVNLGHHLVLSRTALGYTGRDIISYDRITLPIDPLKQLQTRLSQSNVSVSTSAPVVQSSSAGEINLSSDDQPPANHRPWFGKRLWRELTACARGPAKPIDANPRMISDKTLKDLRRLKAQGFDIKVETKHELGDGAFGVVYRGVYTKNIHNLNAKRGKYMSGAAPGGQFAAKYVQFDAECDPEDRLAHEIEKQVLKELRHPNVVAFRAAINLGRSQVVSNARYKAGSGVNFVSYDRMFLVMDYGDCGGKQNSAKYGNQYVVKWADFGLSMSYALCLKWSVNVDAEYIWKQQRSDLVHLYMVFTTMLKKVVECGYHDYDMTEMRALASDMCSLVGQKHGSDRSLAQLIAPYKFNKILQSNRVRGTGR
ncbi:unnamed protein product [Medioppia subpectinata]|uniref:Protein kinase domain-containing protein n=1 Tax=Medioppia subpectinata TaxID=1979941 RepID=A0A7R9KWG6_9ACAR|nr:unnamed protein product [Medioppia subpectinata]CAG2110765.1 unnamed protein product [Medioppia subpectinata]